MALLSTAWLAGPPHMPSAKSRWEEKVDGEASLAAVNETLKESKEALGGRKVKGASLSMNP